MPLDITGLRLRNQRLSGPRFGQPEEAVAWLGAVQAQEYADSKWALALRTRRTSEQAIERAVTAGTILRTHVLRPTWHFVAAADIRWMLSLTGPRVSARMSPYNKHLELDASVFRKSLATIARALRGGVQLTRRELRPILERAGVRTDGVQRLAHIVMQAEVEAVICSGAWRGNQPTYALLDDRVPASRALSRDDALAELTRRYFRSHGPAQVADLVWWSGLTTGDARRGVAMIERELDRDEIDGKTYWFSRTAKPPSRESSYLLGLYDEYLIAYKDRGAVLDRSVTIPGLNTFGYPHQLVIDGRVAGSWSRVVSEKVTTARIRTASQLERSASRGLSAQAERYSRFLGRPFEIELL